MKKYNMNNGQLFACSFVCVIFIGSILLSLPICRTAPASYIDNLFTALSATCVTGLLTVTIADTYNILGQIVIIFLMQIGGLSLMTFIGAFMVSTRQKLSMSDQMIVGDALNKEGLNDVKGFIKRVIFYTLVFEGIGFVLYLSEMVPLYGTWSGAFRSLFLAVSAFCNAGMDNLGGTSLLPFQQNGVINLTTCFLIITGGIGFAVWFELEEIITRVIKRQPKRRMSVHTMTSVSVTLGLLISMTMWLRIYEHMDLMTAFFQSTTLRTAGFYTYEFGKISMATLFIMCLWMLIGGSSGGTAGGLKTTTFAVLVSTVCHYLKSGNGESSLYRRRIPQESILKAFTILGLYAGFLFFGITLLLMFEAEGPLDLAFEAFSAIGTVGISVGITPKLTVIGKIVLMILMFVGRIGPLTLILSVMQKNKSIKYAEENVLIG